MKIGLAQLNSRDDKERNLACAEAAIDRLVAQGADLVVLPEMANFLSSDAENALAAEPVPGPSTERLRAKAREHGVFLHLGSVVESRGGRLYNTSVVFDRAGEEVARYSKIHLFDVELPGGKVYRESAAITPGDQVTTFECEGLTVGLAICYDLRFPELFRALADRGAHLLLVAAAFTLTTGKDQWEPLLRARAIENGCYVAACGQWGPSPPSNQCYGHSMVVDPWGMIAAQCHEGEGTLVVELDMDYLLAVRTRLPVLAHRRKDLFV